MRTSGLALPGALAGMMLLLVVLLISDTAAKLVENTSKFLVHNLTLLFVPTSLGVFFLDRSIYQYSVAILVTIVVSTGLTMLFMALLLKLLQRDTSD